MKTFRKYFLLFVKQIEKLIKSGFNKNTGYFYYARVFTNRGEPVVGYVICRGYRYFWIDGHIIMTVAISKEDLDQKIQEYHQKDIEVDRWKQIC